MVIWYISPCFGILCQEESGNPVAVSRSGGLGPPRKAGKLRRADLFELRKVEKIGIKIQSPFSVPRSRTEI
jgi:hypothetical protein